MKYVVFTNDENQQTVLIFPNHVPHKNMTDDTTRVISHFSNRYPCPKIGEPTSAGFMGINSSGDIWCYGQSESLNLKPCDYDVNLITEEFSMSEHRRSIPT